VYWNDYPSAAKIKCSCCCRAEDDAQREEEGGPGREKKQMDVHVQIDGDVFAEKI